MKKLLLAIAAIVSILVPAYPAIAAEAEVIRSFDSNITIKKDGSAHITERIVYDFGTTQRHGLYRTIPIDYKDGDTRYYTTAKYKQAVDENQKEVQADVYEEEGNLIIKLGDPDVTISGVHTYTISYTLSPIVMKKDGRPFLNLDVLGEGWRVSTEAFSAKVLLEDGASLQNIAWYGAQGTGQQVSAQNVLPYTGITINGFLPDNYVTNYLEPNKGRPFDAVAFFAEFWFLFVILGSIGAGVVIMLVRWWPAHRKRKDQTVIPEYDPPKGMTPAEIGLLDDDYTDMREVTATVIRWAVDGYIKISPIEKKGWFGSKDYQLHHLKSGETLPAHEQKLYEAFFAKGQETTLTKLDRAQMAKATSQFRSDVKELLSKAGYYEKGSNIFKSGTLTEKGAKKWAQVEGFQLYMKVVEQDRLAFSDTPDKTPERFNKLLPYAVALGVEKQWAKQFEGIDVTSSTGWYGGNVAAFSAVSLTNDISTTFATTMSSNASVSSSGGSAGGGAGGGGGGSW